VALDEGGLADPAIPDEHNLEFSDRLDSLR
jgi:hypothetical protein